MLLVVTTPEGQWKAWGTVPSGIEYSSPAELKGREVTINAMVEPKRGEPCFAFLKRPTVYMEPKPRAKAPTKPQRFQRKAREWYAKQRRIELYWGSRGASART
jgi:hypothetical protein